MLLVIPEYELAVVFTGGNYRQGGVWGRWGQQIVGDRIIPALAALIAQAAASGTTSSASTIVSPRVRGSGGSSPSAA